LVFHLCVDLRNLRTIRRCLSVHFAIAPGAVLPRGGCGRRIRVVYWRRQGQGGEPPLAAIKKSLVQQAFSGQL